MISIGSKEMIDCQVGSKKVKEIYKGSKKVWPSGIALGKLLYEGDVLAGGGDAGATELASIPNYLLGYTTKIQIVVTYISGTWVNKFPTSGTDEQTLRIGNPIAYTEFNANVSPLYAEYSPNTSKSVNLLHIIRRSASNSEVMANTSWNISRNGYLTRSNNNVETEIYSDPVHLQVYYQDKY